MLNEILHIRSLGAARNTSGSYSRSSTSTSSTTNNSRSTTTDTNQTSTSNNTTSNNTTSNNTTASSNVSKYSSLLQTLSDGNSYLTLSDGSKIWSIQSSAMSSRSATDSVEHNLNVFLTKYYTHDLLTGRSTDTSDNAKIAAYQTAVQKNKVVTLPMLLSSADYANKIIYVPQGYFYAGKSNENVPKIDNNNNPFNQPAGATLTSDDDTLLYIVIAVAGVVVLSRLFGNNKNETK